MTERLFSLIGIFVILGIGMLMSTSRRKIPWRLVAVGIGLQAYLAIFIVRTDWVPVALTISAAVCAALLINGLFRGREWGMPLARGLGLLGVATVMLSIAISTRDAWWILLWSG